MKSSLLKRGLAVKINSMKKTAQTRDSIIIYTDGACSGNPGPGGWASIVIEPNNQVTELIGSDSQTTNNRMEILATYKALELVQDSDLVAEIYTDSVYVIRGATQWAYGWKKKGWKTADGKDVLNQDLWQAFIVLLAKRKAPVKWHYCRGHQGTVGNERCDELAVLASKKQMTYPYNGRLEEYSFKVIPPPPHEPLPEMKSAKEKAVVHSYMSFVSGIVYRHKDWASCENRVKGKSGAKFKKAMSAGEEEVILKSWGLDAKKTEIKE